MTAMAWLDKTVLKIRSLFYRSRVDSDLDDELQFYLDTETEKHLAVGLSQSEATRAAHRSLGNLTRVKEGCRDAWGLNALDDLRQDVGYASRTLLRSPAFTAAASLIVALGIGANAAVFTVVNAVLFQPPSYDDPDRVVSIYQDSDAGDPQFQLVPVDSGHGHLHQRVLGCCGHVRGHPPPGRRRTVLGRSWSSTSPPTISPCLASSPA